MSSRGMIPGGYLLQFATQANKIQEMLEKDGKPPQSGKRTIDVYAEILKFFTPTEDPTTIYAGLWSDEVHGDCVARVSGEVLDGAKVAAEKEPIPSWECNLDEQFDPGYPLSNKVIEVDGIAPETDEEKIKDIVAALRVMATARQLPLRLVQVIAQYVAAREAAEAAKRE